ncbi:IS982 family transposase, partial [Snuella lapsa]|uniref:IS982 family transposase n=1 Tax=Snuella lapsa TaxID=870481 RepID=UPI0031E6C446
EFASQLENRPLLENSTPQRRNRKGRLSDSEMMSIYLLFHFGQFTNFKHFYTQYVCKHLDDLFPDLISYVRFNARQERVLLPLMLYLKYRGLGKSRGINYIDSTLLRVCHIKREKQHRVFKGIAEKGKSTMGWFFGFKLHLIINDKGELLSFYLTKGNVDDRNLEVMTAMTKEVFGKLFGDKGYISQALADLLFQDGIQLITKVRKNMKKQNLSDVDAILLRKRALVESVNDELKNICKIEHTRHRSLSGFLVNLIAGLVAFCFFPKK